jgi:hypothetical protein
MTQEEKTERKFFVLPFSVHSSYPKDSFIAELVEAAIFSIAEMDRTKGKNLISKQPEEKMFFFSENRLSLMDFSMV